MCFSASASFGAGIVLTVIGVATIKKVQHPSQILFASIPFIFAAQQISEGFLWLALSEPVFASLQNVTTYTFLTLAQTGWPICVPLGIVLLEKKEECKTIQKIVAGIGILLSIYLTFCLFKYNVESKIESHHIKYMQHYPAAIRPYGAVLYIIATIVPLFISRIKGMRLLGITILISYIIATVFYQNYLLSVWCFFASLISLSIFYIIKEIKNSHSENYLYTFELSQ